MTGINTAEGLAELARIVRDARGNRSFRKFAALVGVRESTIKRLEDGLTQSPSDRTIQGLANVIGRSFEELKAIARQGRSGELRDVQTAEEAMFLVRQLSKQEQVRLGKMMIELLAWGETGGE